MVAAYIVAVCITQLLITEVSIWLGGKNIDSTFLLAFLTRELARHLTSEHGDWRATWQAFYHAAFFLNFAVYLTAYWINNYSGNRITPGRSNLLLAVQLACALGGHPALLQLFTAEIGFRFSLRKALGIFLFLSVLYVLTLVPYDMGWTGMSPATPFIKWIAPALGINAQLITLFMGFLARVANRSRSAVAAAHAELLATQQLLAETVRTSERMRIARDLHDTIGHNMAALNLHLDLAARQPIEMAPASIDVARELGERILSDVRNTVSNERCEQAVDLHRALKTLCQGIPEPRIVLDIDPDFEVDMPTMVHAIFCCVQEGLTNAVRHAHASVVTIKLSKRDGVLALDIEDNGRGWGEYIEGNGMRGIRERIEAFDGRVAFDDAPGRGCAIRIRISLSETYS
jgi:signal transduction histidine kinase